MILKKTPLEKSYFSFLGLLIIIYPISIIFSNFLSNFIVYFSSFSIIFYIFYKKKYEVFENKFYIIFIIFCLYITARSLFVNNENLFFSLKSSLSFIRYLFFIIAIKLLIENYNNFLKIFTKFFFVFISIVVFDGFIQYIFGTNLIGMNTINNRVSGFFGETDLVLGSYIARTMYLLIGLVIITKISYNKNIIAVILFFGTLIAFISGERAAFALSILGCLYFLLNSNIFNKKKVAFFLIFLIGIVSLLVNFNSSSNQRFKQTYSDIKTSENIMFFSKGHESHWRAGYLMFKDNKLFGQGANMFRKLCDNKEFNINKKSCSTHPHNFYIQLLAETGIVGFSFIFYFLYQIIILSIKNIINIIRKKEEDIFSTYKICMLTCLLINFWPILPNGNFFSSFLGNIIVFSIAFIGVKEKEPDEPN